MKQYWLKQYNKNNDNISNNHCNTYNNDHNNTHAAIVIVITKSDM